MGFDPGDLAQRDPAALAAAVGAARPFLAFRVSRALAAGDLTTVEGLKLAAQGFTRDVAKLSCCAG